MYPAPDPAQGPTAMPTAGIGFRRYTSSRSPGRATIW